MTDKGIPAALVMATSRSILRSAAERMVSPGKVLARSNDLLYPDIPANMFVTCLYLLIEPKNGKLVFANAGHNLPYRISNGSLTELRAVGMPLGLMPGMEYEEVESQLMDGDCLLLSSDGLVEAHNQNREMYGFARMEAIMASPANTDEIVPDLLNSLNEFTGENHEQEDDITLVTLQYTAPKNPDEADDAWSVVAEFEIPSQPGNERHASQRVIEALDAFHLGELETQRLQTAVAESVMNAMEHGNQYQENLPVNIQVLHNKNSIAVHIRDFGQGIATPEAPQPDLAAKLSGEQSARGWGLFLIKTW